MYIERLPIMADNMVSLTLREEKLSVIARALREYVQILKAVTQEDPSKSLESIFWSLPQDEAHIQELQEAHSILRAIQCEEPME